MTLGVARATRGRARGGLARATRGRTDTASSSASTARVLAQSAIVYGWTGGTETAPFSIPGRLAWDLTPENLALYGLDPIIPGEYIELHHQVMGPGGVAVSLEGATLAFTMRRRDLSADASTVVLARSSADPIDGWTPATQQLVIAEDQTGDGAGKWSLAFAPPDASALSAVIGRWFYDVRAKWDDGQVLTLLRGRVVIPAPRTLFT